MCLNNMTHKPMVIGDDGDVDGDDIITTMTMTIMMMMLAMLTVLMHTVVIFIHHPQNYLQSSIDKHSQKVLHIKKQL